MDPVMFYWVLTLIILIILSMLTDISSASLITAFIITIKYITQPHNKICRPVIIKNEIVEIKKVKKETKQSDVPKEKIPVLPVVDPQILIDNAITLEQVLNPGTYTADDKIFDASINAGYKDKKAKEIRSHWNNNNWKRYYDYEFGIHETENREWWTDNDYEINKKHVVI